MTAIPNPLSDTRLPSTTRPTARPADSPRFDLLIVALVGWFIGGLFLDGWAHNNGYVDNTFFTPWHMVLYSGYGAVGLALTITHLRNVFRGHRFTLALPQGYGLALVGVMLFAAGGGFDFWWHETFGFEANTEALLSPAHLLLASGAFLFITGPLRAAWSRRETITGWRGLLPVILTLLYILSVLTFFTQYSHFNNAPWVLLRAPGNDAFLADVWGIWSIIIPSSLTMGVMLFALRRWTLPFGTWTLIVSVNATLMWLMNWGRVEELPQLLLVGPVIGLLADGLMRGLRPSVNNRLGLRLFSLIVPLALALVYLLLLNAESARGLWWAIHMWLGVPFIAGIVGLFLSYLAVPPALPEAA